MLTQICATLWNIVDSSSTYSFSKEPLLVFSALYKHYINSLDIVEERNKHSKLFGELSMKCIDTISNEKEVYQAFEDILNNVNFRDRRNFQTVVEYFVQKYSYGTFRGEFIQPKEVTQLAYYLLQGEYCEETAIYNPFAGLGSYGLVHNEFIKENERGGGDLSDYYHYYAGEIDETIALIAQVRLVASGLVYPSVFQYMNEDSLNNDSYIGYSGGWSILATPPFGMKTAIDNSGKIVRLEEIVIKQFINAKGFHRATYVFPKAICFDKSFSDLRKELVEKNLVDIIAELPSGIFNSSSISTIIMVLSKDRHADDPVLFVDGSKWFKKESKSKVLDWILYSGKVLDYWNNNTYNSNEMSPVNKVSLISRGYLLLPGLYLSTEQELIPGQELIKLEELIEFVEGEITNDTEGKVLLPTMFSDDVNLIFKNNDFPIDGIRSHMLYKGVDFVLSVLQDKIKICKCSRNDSFYATFNQVPFRLKSSLVSVDYLIYALLNSSFLEKIAYMMTGTSLRTTRQTVRFILDTKIAIDELETQERIISKLKDEYTYAKRAELEAEMQRLGIRTATSDLSHMLGMTFDKVGNNISYMLGADLPQDIKESLYALNDNFEYMKRFISTVGADFTSSSISKVEVGVNKFINSYLQSWGNYGNTAFTLSYDSRVMDDTTFCIDEGMMRVLFDTVLDNAYKHGFNKESSLNNRVVISSSCTTMNDQEYILITIANNGNSLTNDFSLKKYVLRGVYFGESGGTGLGGNHIYSIVKRHNGYLNVSSSAAWSVIIELLIPVELYSEAETNNFESYGNADKCL